MAAGRQAIARRELWRLAFADDVSTLVGIPGVLGALVTKAAAWLTDSRTRQDAATLLAAAGDVSGLNYGDLSKNDRRRLRALDDQLRDPAHPAWLVLDGDERPLGSQNLELIMVAADGDAVLPRGSSSRSGRLKD